jgi:hypothetical protein
MGFDDAVCDFCNDGGAVCEYPISGAIRMVLDEGETLVLEGPWAACATCSEFIERDDYESLAARPFARSPAGDLQSLASRTSLYRQFRANRCGPRRTLPSASRKATRR